MQQKLYILSDEMVRELNPKPDSYRVSDGYNLFIQVNKSGRKVWKYVFQLNRRHYVMDLGEFPKMNCDGARERARNCAELRDKGINPKHLHTKMVDVTIKHTRNSLGAALNEWYGVKKHQWTKEYMAKTMRRMGRHVVPVLGTTPLVDVTRADILSVIRRIEAAGSLAESKAVYQLLKQFFEYAIATNAAYNDPTYAMKPALATRRKKHHKSLPFDEVPNFISGVRAAANFDLTIRYAAELMLHTFVRVSELTGARWDEVDFKNRVWVIPAERMKMGRAHVVPLSREAMRILKNLHRRNGNREYVFATPKGSATKHISDFSIRRLMYQIGYKGEATVHGFRSLAMTVLQEKLGYPFEVVDAQLAHAKRHSLGEAYDRALFLDRRKLMMEDWSKLIERKCDELSKQAG